MMDHVDNISDNATFHHGDICYIKMKYTFGVVCHLLRVNKTQYADLQLFCLHQVNPKTVIPYADKSPTTTMSVELLSNISVPLVTPVEGNDIWFVNYYNEKQTFLVGSMSIFNYNKTYS